MFLTCPWDTNLPDLIPPVSVTFVRTGWWAQVDFDDSEDEVDSGAVDSDDCGVCCCCDDGNSSTVGSSSSEIHKIKSLIFNLL